MPVSLQARFAICKEVAIARIYLAIATLMFPNNYAENPVLSQRFFHAFHIPADLRRRIPSIFFKNFDNG